MQDEFRNISANQLANSLTATILTWAAEIWTESSPIADSNQTGLHGGICMILYGAMDHTRPYMTIRYKKHDSDRIPSPDAATIVPSCMLRIVTHTMSLAMLVRRLIATGVYCIQKLIELFVSNMTKHQNTSRIINIDTNSRYSMFKDLKQKYHGVLPQTPTKAPPSKSFSTSQAACPVTKALGLSWHRLGVFIKIVVTWFK